MVSEVEVEGLEEDAVMATVGEVEEAEVAQWLQWVSQADLVARLHKITIKPANRVKVYENPDGKWKNYDVLRRISTKNIQELPADQWRRLWHFTMKSK